MSNKMLIDATHPEETRVVVLRGNKVEEFDFEAADRQQLRGNIYLAKVTRVEPSLQAAFVDYGGNRHGFLAFSEIHPDYYQIPFADRQLLLQEQAREEAEQAEEEDARADRESAEEAARDAEDEGEEPETIEALGAASHDDDGDDPDAAAAEDGDGFDDDDGDSTPGSGGAMAAEKTPGESVSEPAGPEAAEDAASAEATEARSAPAEEPEGEDGAEEHEPKDDDGHGDHDHDDEVESVGAEDALEEVPERRKPRPRQYKIQEVIKRRQVLLVQVVKEERGNKGAALTTYLSLAGRYSVLMPNTARGGGISRKITNPTDRKRLKSIAGELEVPDGMGVILRTAGANRTKSEVKRDFEYLLRLWENVRELTLRSSAPKLVYEEGSLIKRSIRDLYSREIDQIVVAGEDAYREAKDFMRMLMPSHARNVQLYKDTNPIFARNSVEAQLDAMFSPQVTLKSGGYIVINQTEALVSIDVNSGRSTREHSIEDTALNTNLEAAEEISRQLRLRDLAGLIVIDFIDMEEKRNNRSVERKLKDCLRADRARIQVGRISHFGLLEMSRQRIRTGVLESSTVPCSHCRGTGQVRSVSSMSLQILRALEDHLLRHSGHHLSVRTRPEVALYILNQKRTHLSELEARFGIAITVVAEAPDNGAGFMIERGAVAEDRPERSGAIAMVDMPEPEEAYEPEPEADEEREAESGGEGREKRKRRRRRRGGEDRGERGDRNERGDRERRHADASDESERASDDEDDEDGNGESAEASSDSEDRDGREPRRRRRGRRGGKRRGRGRENGERENGEPEAAASDQSDSDQSDDEDSSPAPAYVDGESAVSVDDGDAESVAAEGPEPVSAETASDAEEAPETKAAAPEPEAAQEPEHAPEPVAEAEADPAAEEPAAPEPEPIAAAEPQPEPVAQPDENRPKRSGWWNRKSSFF